MKNKKLILAVVAVLILGGISFTGVKSYAARGKTAKEVAGDKSNDTQQVALANDKATPDTITVLVGHSVQFNTADGLKHDMGQGDGGDHHVEDSTYESGEFGPGESWRVTFNKPGTYHLHDHEHPNISVLVVAYQSEK